MWSQFKDIPVHGDPVTGKVNNTFRFYFENVDGFVVPDGNANKKHKNKHKQIYLSLLLSRLEVNMYGGVEPRLQFDRLPKSKSLIQTPGSTCWIKVSYKPQCS